MRVPKYLRIQGREIAYRTQKPVGVFVLNWRRVRDGVYSEYDIVLTDSPGNIVYEDEWQVGTV